MKKRIVKWLLKKLLSTETKRDILYNIIKASYADNMTIIVDRELQEIIFDAKYAIYSENDKTPYEMLQSFYKDAGLGKRSFMKYDLYRQMRRDKDSEVSKLNYKLKRNET